MAKSKWNMIVDALLLTVILDVAFIGVLMAFFIPKGGAAGSRVFWGLHRHTWGDIHLYLSLALLALVVLHFILHLPWISSTSRKHLRLPWPAALAAIALLGALVLGGLGVAFQSRNAQYEGDGGGAGTHEWHEPGSWQGGDGRHEPGAPGFESGAGDGTHTPRHDGSGRGDGAGRFRNE